MIFKFLKTRFINILDTTIAFFLGIILTIVFITQAAEPLIDNAIDNAITTIIIETEKSIGILDPVLADRLNRWLMQELDEVE